VRVPENKQFGGSRAGNRFQGPESSQWRAAEHVERSGPPAKAAARTSLATQANKNKVRAQRAEMAGHVKNMIALNKQKDDKDFVVVKADEKGKVASVVPGLSTERSMGREYMKSMFGQKPYRTVLIVETAIQSSGAGAQQAPVVKADPVVSSDFTNFAALFDDVRTVDAKCIATCLISAGVITTIGSWAFVWDPAESGVLGTIKATLAYSRHAGPIVYSGVFGSGNLAWSAQPLPVTNHGYVELSSGRIPANELPLNNSGTLAVEPIGSNWTPTTSTAAVAGYFKFVAESPGLTTPISNLKIYQYLTVEFRFRG